RDVRRRLAVAGASKTVGKQRPAARCSLWQVQPADQADTLAAGEFNALAVSHGSSRLSLNTPRVARSSAAQKLAQYVNERLTTFGQQASSRRDTPNGHGRRAPVRQYPTQLSLVNGRTREIVR